MSLTKADRDAAREYDEQLPEAVLGSQSIRELEQAFAAHRLAERARILGIAEEIVKHHRIDECIAMFDLIDQLTKPNPQPTERDDEQ